MRISSSVTIVKLQNGFGMIKLASKVVQVFDLGGPPLHLLTHFNHLALQPLDLACELLGICDGFGR